MAMHVNSIANLTDVSRRLSSISPSGCRCSRDPKSCWPSSTGATRDRYFLNLVLIVGAPFERYRRCLEEPRVIAMIMMVNMSSRQHVDHVLQVRPTLRLIDNNSTCKSQVCAWHIFFFQSGLSSFLQLCVTLSHEKSPHADAQVHGSDFLIQAIRLLFTKICTALAFCLWVPTMLGLGLFYYAASGQCRPGWAG